MKHIATRMTAIAFAAMLIGSAGDALGASSSGKGGGGGLTGAMSALANLFLGGTLLGPDQTGQPSKECGEEDAPNRPGHAATASGSAFNPDGKAGTVYAGEQPQNSKNTASVSQYDVACAHVPAH